MNTRFRLTPPWPRGATWALVVLLQLLLAGALFAAGQAEPREEAAPSAQAPGAGQHLPTFPAFAPLGGGPSSGSSEASEKRTTEPGWLLLEQGKQAFRDRHFGTALALIRESIAKGGDTPEAQMWIGKVFEEEGELPLAVDQYERALAMKQQFVVREDALEVQYALANIYYETNQYGKYEVILREIVGKDAYFSSREYSGLRDAMIRILRTGGFDRLMLLYRLTYLPALKAHSDLGAFMYRTGRYSEATLNLCFAAITDFTTAINELRRTNPDFEFSTTPDLMRRSLADPRLAGYLSQVGLYRDLYYLAAALYANGSGEESRVIWRLDAAFAPKSDPYRERSAVQLRKPYIEPILDVGA